MAELRAGLEEAEAGHGSVFLVTGEPGIGKTRLADEVARIAGSRGFGVHWGRAWEVGGAPSYWPITQVLRSLSRSAEPTVLEKAVGPHGSALARLLPELPQMIPGIGHAATGDDRFVLLEALTAVIHALAASAPQALIFDDLHAADASSRVLIGLFAREVRSARVLFLGTYRDAEARLNPEVGQSLARLSREATVLPLRRLERDEVAELIAQATGEAPASDRIEAIHRRTEGNPLFVRELLRLRGRTAREPAGIEATVQARLALLPSEVRGLLEAAAVLGRDFWLDPLGRVAVLPEREVRDRLAVAADAGIVEPLEHAGRWHFTHVLLREGLYQDLTTEARAKLHRAAAAELRRRIGEPRHAELAHHMLHAVPLVPIDEASAAALCAAEAAMERLAFEDAEALLSRTLACVEREGGSEGRVIDITLALGLAQIRSAEVETGKRTCARAAALARSLGDGDRFARAILASRYEYTPGVREAGAIAHLEEALERLSPGDGPLRARCLAQLAAERQPELDPQGPVALAREAVAIARRCGETETLRTVLVCAGMAMLVYGDLDERIGINGEALRLALAAGDKRLAIRAHLFLANDLRERGDRAGSVAHARAYEALTHEFRHTAFRWVAKGFHAVEAVWAGKLDDAVRLYAESLELSRADETFGASMAAVPVGLCRAIERYDDLPGIEAAVRARFGGMAHEVAEILGELLIAQLYGAAGDRARATTQLANVRAHPSFSRLREPAWLRLLVEPVHLLGDRDLAGRIYPALLSHADRFFNLGPLGPCFEPPYSRQLGLMAQTLGRLDDAVAHLAHAEEETTRVEMRSHLARLRYELAGVLLERRAPGDLDRATTMLGLAAALAEELGQRDLIPLVQARLHGAPAAPPTRSFSTPVFTLQQEGDVWAIAHGGKVLRLRSSRGLALLAQLVAEPGREFHVLQLVSGAGETPDGGDAGAHLDPTAIEQYRAKLLELREDLEDAEEQSDAGRAEKSRSDIESLTAELARAVGLGGRERRAGLAAERARTTVQKRIKSAVQRIADGLPELAAHFESAIRTGAFCGYLPEGRVGTKRRVHR